MRPMAALLLVLSIALGGFAPSGAGAQYMYLDANGDGVHTPADVVQPLGTTLFEIWLTTDWNRDGTEVVCGDGTSQLTINAYSLSLQAVGGIVAWSDFVDRIGFDTDLGSASSETEYWVSRGSGTHQLPGTHRLASLSVTALGGSPELRIVEAGGLGAQDETSFGSQCGGLSTDGTLRLGLDWHDTDGLAWGGASSTTPVLGPIAAMTVEQTETAIQTFDATDPDGGEITLSKSAGPPFMQLVTVSSGAGAAQGRIELTPASGTDVGDHVGVVRASDATSFSERSFAIKVTPLQLPPITFHPTPDGTVAVHDTLALPLHADPEEWVQFGVVQAPFELRRWFGYIGLERAIYFAPNASAHVGVHQIILFATFGYSDAVYDTLILTVTPNPMPPVLEVEAPASMRAGLEGVFGLRAFDPDSDPLTSLTFDGSDLPAGDAASFTTGAGFRTAELRWTPSRAGLFTPRFSVTDASGAETVVEAPTVVTDAAARAFATGGSDLIALASPRATYCWRLEPVGAAFDRSEIVAGSLQMVGSGPGGAAIPAHAWSTPPEGDTDGNGIEEGLVCFDRDDVRALFAGSPPGAREQSVSLTGRLASGAILTAALTLRIEAPAGPSLAVAPNPMNPSGYLTLFAPAAGDARVTIHDVRGRLVRTLRSGALPAGYHDFPIDGRDDRGRRLASGAYFCVAVTAAGTATRRITILR